MINIGMFNHVYVIRFSNNYQLQEYGPHSHVCARRTGLEREEWFEYRSNLFKFTKRSLDSQVDVFIPHIFLLFDEHDTELYKKYFDYLSDDTRYVPVFTKSTDADLGANEIYDYLHAKNLKNNVVLLKLDSDDLIAKTYTRELTRQYMDKFSHRELDEVVILAHDMYITNRKDYVIPYHKLGQHLFSYCPNEAGYVLPDKRRMLLVLVYTFGYYIKEFSEPVNIYEYDHTAVARNALHSHGPDVLCKTSQALMLIHQNNTNQHTLENLIHDSAEKMCMCFKPSKGLFTPIFDLPENFWLEV